MHITRRKFLGSCAAVCAAAGVPLEARGADAARRFNLSISVEALDADPELLSVVADAGVSDAWLAGFFYGHWPYPFEKIMDWRRKIEQAGLGCHIINVPLGHPGDSLGSQTGNVPLTTPQGWKYATTADGKLYSGTSLHAPATEENIAAVKKFAATGVDIIFLDDDFRLARGPGIIGGCFCDEHKKRFCDTRGCNDSQWQELLDSVQRRSLTPILRSWVEFTCDELTGSFRAQQAATPEVRLGNMIMYLGAEKAGIRLTDYTGHPFRVGELMFNDAEFNPVKGKTDELFSVLFHRRFTSPESAYSETTAYPSAQLSAPNMAAKLAISTISDVRNTMFMSGVTAFPKSHWSVLKPAMRRQADLHRRVAGHVPRGPFKHYWGEAGRYVGDDKPYSLFLASGIPFEVTGEISKDGWTFLSDADAAIVPKSSGTQLIARKPGEGMREMPESLDQMFALKHEIKERLADVPFVENDKPVVCAWYPSAGGVLLWNVGESRETFNLVRATVRKDVAVDSLDSVFVEI